MADPAEVRAAVWRLLRRRGGCTDGITVNIDPEAWRIIDGKLYLSYDKGYAAEFEAKSEELIAKADANWPAVKAELKQQPYN